MNLTLSGKAYDKITTYIQFELIEEISFKSENSYTESVDIHRDEVVNVPGKCR